MHLSVQKVRDFFYDTHRDESGAVALLCLAAILALMLVAWVILDAGKSSRDKIALQGAADAAAMSQASVKARTMNVISYANIAKRSIVGIHAMYPGMFFAYTLWLLMQAGRCFKIWPNVSACVKFFTNAPMWAWEFVMDHRRYSGNPMRPYIEAATYGFTSALNKISKAIGKIKSKTGVGYIFDLLNYLLGGGNTDNYHLKDLQAIDNYQHYMRHITPWWGWGEQLAKGWRNGATTTASFPAPPGSINRIMRKVQGVLDRINRFLSRFGAGTINLRTHSRFLDDLPLKKSSWGWAKWLGHMISGTSDFRGLSLSDIRNSINVAYAAEHAYNTLEYRRNSSQGAKKGFVWVLGSTVGFATVGMAYTMSALGDQAAPHIIDTGSVSNDGEWLTRTSNMILAYHNDPERMGTDRDKLRVPDRDYEHALGPVDDLFYKSTGYWTMSKAEFTFNGENWEPDMWHPSWTSRLRPVHLPQEFSQAGYSMNIAYHDVLPYLALSAQVGNVRFDGARATGSAILRSLWDFVIMELTSRSMGPSTINGVAK